MYKGSANNSLETPGSTTVALAKKYYKPNVLLEKFSSTLRTKIVIKYKL